jgi:preprotein translocase subunit SecG
MTLLFVILIILACTILGLIVLIQNPKGGGLAGNIAGFSTQFMGVKQTTDVLEKGTWLFAAIIGVLCLVSSIFITGGTDNSALDKGTGSPTQPAPQPGAPNNAAPFPAPASPTQDTGK